MPNNTIRFLGALLLILSAPQALAQRAPDSIGAPLAPHLTRPFAPPAVGLQQWLANTPWSPDMTILRYQEVCAGIWEPPLWALSQEQAWRAVAAIADNAPGDLEFAKAHLRAMAYYVVNMKDSELYPLTLHLGQVSKLLPRESNTWIQLQAWRVTLLTNLMMWEDSIPLLEEIEAVLLAEDTESSKSIKPVFVHLDCSTTYHTIGISERAMEHLARAEVAFEREPVTEDSPFTFMHLTLHRLLLSAAHEDHRESVRILEQAQLSALYKRLSPVVKGVFEFRLQLSMRELGETTIEEVEEAFEVLMLLTDPNTSADNEGYDPFRLSALSFLSSYYIHQGRFRKARELHAEKHLLQRVREAVKQLKVAIKGDGRIPVEVSSFLPHFMASTQADTTSIELLDWLRTTYELRLQETANTKLLPLGMGGSAFSDTNSLAECLIRAELQINPGPLGAERALETILKLETGGTLARYLHAELGNLQKIQDNLLTPNSGIYHIHVGWDHSYVLLIDDGQVSAKRLGKSADFIKRSKRLKRELYQAQNYGVKGARLELAIAAMEEFLLPVELSQDMELRGWQSIAFSGFEGRSYVPMELLKLKGGERLGDRMPVTYYPSLTVALALSARRNGRAGQGSEAWLSLVATSAPEYMSSAIKKRMTLLGSNLQALPFTSKDFTSLFGSFPIGIPLQVKRETSATQEALWAGSASHVGALFVLGHGSRDDDLAASPGLLLRTQTGATTVVGPSDLGEFESPPFVMLVVCGTTDAVERSGDDGAQHLVGTLLRQGADTVLAAHLPLGYEDSKRLSAVVIEGLTVKGLSPAEALWQARLQLGDEAGYPGRYLLHAGGLADRSLHAPAPPAEPRSTQWANWVALAGVLGITALLVRVRAAA